MFPDAILLEPLIIRSIRPDSWNIGKHFLDNIIELKIRSDAILIIFQLNYNRIYGK